MLMCGCLTMMQLLSSLNGSDGKTQRRQVYLLKKKKKLQGCLVLLYVSVILEKQAEDRKERERERGEK